MTPGGTPNPRSPMWADSRATVRRSNGLTWRTAVTRSQSASTLMSGTIAMHPTSPSSTPTATTTFYDDGLLPGEVHFATLTVPAACESCGAWAMVDSYDMVSESPETDNTFFYSHAE